MQGTLFLKLIKASSLNEKKNLQYMIFMMSTKNYDHKFFEHS